jgi:hypothetical protein
LAGRWRSSASSRWLGTSISSPSPISSKGSDRKDGRAGRGRRVGSSAGAGRAAGGAMLAAGGAAMAGGAGGGLSTAGGATVCGLLGTAVDDGATSSPSSLANWLQSVWLRCCAALVRRRSGIGCLAGELGSGCGICGLDSAPSSRANDSQ